MNLYITLEYYDVITVLVMLNWAFAGFVDYRISQAKMSVKCNICLDWVFLMIYDVL